MKHMQLLVRVQFQIQSHRIQMFENQALYRFKNDKEAESTLGKWISQASEAGNENWDDSVVTKEEREARKQRKVEAAIKRKRAMAYAYSNQVVLFLPAYCGFNCSTILAFEPFASYMNFGMGSVEDLARDNNGNWIIEFYQSLGTAKALNTKL
ncbi:hypothetical protein V6N13_022021 [Hibiscus sabdariffa]